MVDLCRCYYNSRKQVQCFFNLGPLPKTQMPKETRWLDMALTAQFGFVVGTGVSYEYLLASSKVYSMLRGLRRLDCKSHIQAYATMLHLTKPIPAQSFVDLLFPILIAAILPTTDFSVTGVLGIIFQLFNVTLTASQLGVSTFMSFHVYKGVGVQEIFDFSKLCLFAIYTCESLVPGSKWLAFTVCVWRGFQQFCYLRRAIEFREILRGILIARIARYAANAPGTDVAAAEVHAAVANRIVTAYPAVGKYLTAAEFHQQQIRNESSEACERAHGVRLFDHLMGQLVADNNEDFAGQ